VLHRRDTITSVTTTSYQVINNDISYEDTSIHNQVQMLCTTLQENEQQLIHLLFLVVYILLLQT